MKSSREAYSANFFTASGPSTKAAVKAQDVFKLIRYARAWATEFLASRGYRPLPGSAAPALNASGDRPDHASDPAAYHAEMAIVMGCRFEQAWIAKDYARAAEFAYLTAEYRAKGYMHSRKLAQVQKSKRATSAGTAARDRGLVAAARAKLEEKRGLATVAELHRWLNPPVEVKRYHAILENGGLGGAERRKIREKFLAKR